MATARFAEPRAMEEETAEVEVEMENDGLV
jgi:hypothetical protein